MDRNPRDRRNRRDYRGYRARRMAVASAVLALATVGYVAGLGWGTPSAWGLDRFFLICPLGGMEALLAGKAAVPQLVVSLVVSLALALALGRAWCAWACPAQIVRGIAGRVEERAGHAVHEGSMARTFARDSRLWVLAGMLVAALVVGFPVFCLVCPVGLTFGTVFSIVRLIGSNAVDWGLLAFPAALALELVAFKKWCTTICPIAGLLGLLGRFARPLRPHVDGSTCLMARGGDCHRCRDACPEAIDLHAPGARYRLADCTRCAECRAACPTASITMPLVPVRGRSSAELPVKSDQNASNMQD